MICDAATRWRNYTAAKDIKPALQNGPGRQKVAGLIFLKATRVYVVNERPGLPQRYRESLTTLRAAGWAEIREEVAADGGKTQLQRRRLTQENDRP